MVQIYTRGGMLCSNRVLDLSNLWSSQTLQSSTIWPNQGIERNCVITIQKQFLKALNKRWKGKNRRDKRPKRKTSETVGDVLPLLGFNNEKLLFLFLSPYLDITLAISVGMGTTMDSIRSGSNWCTWTPNLKQFFEQLLITNKNTI